MKLDISKKWLEQNRQADEGHNIEATSPPVPNVVKHIISGELYEILGVVTNKTTGEADGQWMARYRKVGGEEEFVRETREFRSKFTLAAIDEEAT